MAKVKFSAFVSDIRNKSNGSVFSKNRYGSIIRNKVTPVNPQSNHQQEARQRLGNLSSSFRELTIAQILSWNLGGQKFPFTDIFGDIKHLSGQTLFVKLNANLEKIGAPRVLTAPSPVGFPEVSITGVTIEVVADSISTFTADIDLTTIPVGYELVVYATPSVSRSISFVKNKFRFLGSFAVTVNSVDLANAYSARFPTPLVGDQVYIKMALVATATGQQSIPLLSSGLVEEA